MKGEKALREARSWIEEQIARDPNFKLTSVHHAVMSATEALDALQRTRNVTLRTGVQSHDVMSPDEAIAIIDEALTPLGDKVEGLT